MNEFIILNGPNNLDSPSIERTIIFLGLKELYCPLHFGPYHL